MTSWLMCRSKEAGAVTDMVCHLMTVIVTTYISISENIEHIIITINCIVLSLFVYYVRYCLH